MLLHLSDLHFGTEQPRVCRAVVALCEQLQPEAVVVSGDLTQRARQEQFVAARTFLTGLKRPLLVVAGNHDVPLFHVTRRIFTPYDYFQRYFGELEPVLETEQFYLIGVNSVSRHHHTQGSISNFQILQAGERLRHAPSTKTKLIVSHQPFAASDPDDQAEAPRLMHRAVQYWSRFGLAGLLHGHLHTPAVFDLNQRHALRLDRPILDIQAGTALSTRLRQNFPNSVNLIYADMRVERLDFNPISAQFACIQQLWPSTPVAS